jgi:hypothetical protein
MADFNALVAPFQKTAEFLKDPNLYLMVPFKQWDVRSKLNKPDPPKTPDVNLSSVPGLPALVQLIPGAGGIVGDLTTLVGDLTKGRLGQFVPDLIKLLPDGLNFVRQQVGLGVSLLVLLDVFKDTQKIAPAVTEAYQSYFFDDDGFTTLEGGKIAPPTFNIGPDSTTPTLTQIASQIRKFASHKTADQYIRDLIRVTVEASGDALFDLNRRYKRMTTRTDDLGKQEQSWFKGFASLAESMVTSTVEETAQGVSSFSTNPLLAASLATFAGTVARKSTQNAFLLEIGIDLPAAP